MDEYLQKIKNIVLEYLSSEKVKIFLFGSRARKDNHLTSDVDIGIMPYGEFDENKITLLKERMEDFNTPYKVEFVDFRYVSADFKEEAMKNIAIWKD